MAKKVKVKFLKSPTGAFKLGYNAGDIGKVDEKQAKILFESGYATIPDENESELPEDLPGRKVFVKLGINSLDEIKSIRNFSELRGIDKLTIIKLKEYLIAKENSPEPSELPEDLPAREIFIDMGVKNLKELKELGEFAEIQGIGEKTAEKITAFLESLE